MIVACATDRRFTQLAGVMLASLFQNGEVAGDWRVIVFGYRLRARDKALLRQSAGANGARLEFVDVDPGSSYLKRLLPTHFAMSPAPYLRILIPALLGDETGRLAYLDSDTLVLSSLKPLAELNMEGRPLAAVEDHDSTNPALRGHLPFPADRAYFNSGVLVFDLNAWRDRDLTGRCFRFIAAHEDEIDFPDQDTLNCVLDGEWKPLGPEWNVTRRAAEEKSVSPHIVHFTGTKPWSAGCKHPARELFLHYRRLTPWRDDRLKSNLETRLGRSLNKRWRSLRVLSGRRARPPQPGA